MNKYKSAGFVASIYFFILILFPHSAYAFPELIRHGYVNCLTCHVSPSGGGALNDYGRTFSGEGLSTWTSKNEESIFEGLITRDQIPSWLSVGGDFRSGPVFHQNSVEQDNTFYWMQADLEAAAKINKFTFDFTGGRFQIAREEPRFKSRRFFVMYNFTDEWMIRVGRFLPSYGVNLPDHIIATRMPLNFDQGQERYNIEASWITDTWSAVLTASQGPVEFPTSQEETSGEAQLAYAFADTYKIGINGWSGGYNNTLRNLGGFFANLGFSDNLFLLSETDWQWLTPYSNNVTQLGFFTYNKFGYEILHGLNLLATAEFWQSDLSDQTTAVDRYGIGSEFFPRPHFDFTAMYTKQRIHPSSDLEDYAWLILHYYF